MTFGYAWTTAGNGELSHIKLIGSGGSGAVVHQVRMSGDNLVSHSMYTASTDTKWQGNFAILGP
jgi:hypothetical protein